jgi:hypothetical protein
MKTLELKYYLFGLFAAMGYSSLKGMDLEDLFSGYQLDQYNDSDGLGLFEEEQRENLVDNSENKKRKFTEKKQSLKKTSSEATCFIVCDYQSCNKNLSSINKVQLLENYLSHYASCHTSLETPDIRTEVNEGKKRYALTCPSCDKNLCNNQQSNIKGAYAKHHLLNHNEITKERLKKRFSEKVLLFDEKITINNSQLKEGNNSSCENDSQQIFEEMPTSSLKKRRQLLFKNNKPSTQPSLPKEGYAFSCVLCKHFDRGDCSETLQQKYLDHLMQVHKLQEINRAGIISSVRTIEK